MVRLQKNAAATDVLARLPRIANVHDNLVARNMKILPLFLHYSCCFLVSSFIFCLVLRCYPPWIYGTDRLSAVFFVYIRTSDGFDQKSENAAATAVVATLPQVINVCVCVVSHLLKTPV